MSALAELSPLVGKWQGTNHLWLAPDEPVRLSESTAEIRAIAQDQFSELLYTWSESGLPQEGRMILGRFPDSPHVRAIWLDTWHMMNQFMDCEGGVNENGEVWVRGSYPAPPGPDWGWQITFAGRGADAFRLQMHNITPEGEMFLAVEVAYTRQP